MRSFVIIFVICNFTGAIFANNNLIEKNNNTKITKLHEKCESNLDILIDELLSQSWIEDERPCLEQILKTIYNVKNSTFWATWLWDSIQLPVGQLYGSRYHLGNYDQCLRQTVAGADLLVPTQYCLAEVTLQRDKMMEDYEGEMDLYDSVERYIHPETKYKHRFNVITWGICTPQICQIKSVKSFLKALLKQSHIGLLKSPVEITIDSCEVSGESKKHTDSFYILITAVLLITMHVLICTLYLSKCKFKSDSFVIKVIKCFCLKRNMKEFLGSQNDYIKILHGMRFFSSCVIVSVHILGFFLLISTVNGLDFEQVLYSIADPALNSLIVVDTFFLMSGLLLIRSIKSNSSFTNLWKLIIKRYFRLIWWYIIVLITVLFILPRTGCGPLCSNFMKLERGSCLKTWWMGMLMLTNYIDGPNLCISTCWYIFCDFQLTVVAAVLVWLYQRQRRTGLICFMVLVILSVLLPGIFTYNSSEIMENIVNFDYYKEIKGICNSSTIFWSLYTHTHHRATPYLLGIMMGYIMTKYEPKNFRNTISKKQSLSALLTFIAIIAVIILSCSYMDIYLRYAVFVALHRLIWASMICLLIAVCEYGSFPYVTDFLSWPIFVPLGKLTYGIYMVHIIPVAYNMLSIRSPLYFNGYIMLEKFLGNLTLASFISLFVLLFIEAPLNNLVKLFLNKTNTCEKLRKDI